MNNENKVFVYGTLMKGLGNHHILKDSQYLGKYAAQGKMFAVSSFPGILLSDYRDELIFGEVYVVNDSVLGQLDFLEGYDSESEDNSMYNRRKILVRSNGGKVHRIMTANIYVWNESDGEMYKYDRIESGDYRKWIKEQYNDENI